MKTGQRRRIATAVFVITLAVIFACFFAALIRTNTYNNLRHEAVFSGPELFSDGSSQGGITVSAVARGSTWGKIFDFNNEGITENNYQAYTYDFTVFNDTKDELRDFVFKLTFSRDVYLASAWNGSLQIHQHVGGAEITDVIPDLRDFNADDYQLEFVTVDGETFVPMKAGDYLVYYPSSSANAMEIPVESHEGTTPGCILYVANDENIEQSTLTIWYTFHRLLTSEVLFWVAVAGAVIWLTALVVTLIMSAQMRKFQERHDRDNRIINESIETFTGFIDAKDPYTNGHSKRVATYTRLIAQKMGYEGEELDRIYYVALLHDCGKIGVPDSILGKPDRLTDEEFAVIKNHTVRGSEILSSFKSLDHVGEGALYHHERYDGKGYPTGKAGEEIPLIARMICVADSFDAMNSNRVYRKRLTKKQIIDEIDRNRERQFDPRIADVMLELILTGVIEAG